MQINSSHCPRIAIKTIVGDFTCETLGPYEVAIVPNIYPTTACISYKCVVTDINYGIIFNIDIAGTRIAFKDIVSNVARDSTNRDPTTIIVFKSIVSNIAFYSKTYN